MVPSTRWEYREAYSGHTLLCPILRRDVRNVLLLLEQVPDLHQKLFRGRGFRWWWKRIGLQLVHDLDDKKDAESNNDEIHRGLEKIPPVQRYPRGSFLDAWNLFHSLPDDDLVVSEIDATRQDRDDRHDDIGDERADDLSERATDDDSHSEVDHVSAHGESLEFFDERHSGKR